MAYCKRYEDMRSRGCAGNQAMQSGVRGGRTNCGWLRTHPSTARL